MGTFIDKLEAKTGRKCPRCNVREWPTKSKYTTVEEERYLDESGWSRKEFLVTRVKHLRCGNSWPVTKQLRPSGGGG